MRKIFNERSLVVVLFIVALVVFSLASEDARKIEARNFQARVKQSSPGLVDNTASPTHAGAHD